MITIFKVLIVLLSISIAWAAPPNSVNTVTKVNCDKGQLLSDAILKSSDGQTIEVSGNCNEPNIIIYQDQLKIRGTGNAVLDSPSNSVMTISGRMVEIIDLEVHASIVVQEHGSAWIQGVTATNMPGNRPAIFAWYSGYIWLYQSQIINNPADAVRADANSVIDIEESTIANNGWAAVSADLNSVIRLRDNNILGNMLGIRLLMNSSLMFLGHNTVSGHSWTGLYCDTTAGYKVQVAQTFSTNGTDLVNQPGCHSQVAGGITFP